MVASLRTVLAGLVAIPLLARSAQRPPADRVSRKLLVVSAAAGFVVFPVLFTVGQARTSALHGVMILAALPIGTGAYASLVARRVPPAAWLAGSGVALVGEVVLIGGRGARERRDAGGDLLVAAAALCVSAGYVAGALLPPRGLSSLATTLLGCRTRDDRARTARDRGAREGDGRTRSRPPGVPSGSSRWSRRSSGTSGGTGRSTVVGSPGSQRSSSSNRCRGSSSRWSCWAST